MSLRTQIRGYTLWVNLRLQPTNVTLSNVVVDILKSFHLKALFESLNGHNYEKLDNFDNLTQLQLVTRAERVIEEMRKSNLLLPEVDFDTNMFSMKKYDQIFDCLWCFVVHDIYFAWERAYLFAQENVGMLLKVPFTWYPDEFMKRANEGFYKRVGAFKHNVTIATQEQQFNRFMQDITAGMPDPAQNGANANANAKARPKRKSVAAYSFPNPFPEHDMMKQLNAKVAPTLNNEAALQVKPANRYGVSPSECVIEMVQIVLRGSKEGLRLAKKVKALPNLADSRVLCALLNWLYPRDGGAVPSELLLQDRLTINLVLRTLERLLQLPESPFCSEDLVECDARSVCAYFCAILLKAFQFRQYFLAERRHASLRFQILEESTRIKLLNARLAALLSKAGKAAKEADLGEGGPSIEVQKLRHNLEDAQTEIKVIKVQLSVIEAQFPMAKVVAWVTHAGRVVDEVRNALWDRFETARYERVTLPRTMTLHEFTHATATNLSLTKGVAFYKLTKFEELMRSRKVLIKRQAKRKNAKGVVETHDVWIDNFTGNKEQAEHIARLLGFDSSRVISVPVDPQEEFAQFAHENFEMFVDVISGNKELDENFVLLYQAFPRNFSKLCTDVLFKLLADRQGEAAQTHERSRSASPQRSNHGRREQQQQQREMFDVTAFKRVAMFVRMRMPRLLVEARHPAMGDSLLHVAAHLGAPYFDLCELLLECGCDVNAVNSLNQTALHKAVDAQSLEIVHLLIEWGADVNVRDRVRCTPFEYARVPQLLEACTTLYKHYAAVVPNVVEHANVALLHTLVDQYAAQRRRAAAVARRTSALTAPAKPTFANVRSQVLNGSTLLHTAVHFNAFDLVLKLLLLLLEDFRARNRLYRDGTCSAFLGSDFFSLSVTGPCNVLDFQQATALHRAKSPAIASVLLKFNMDLRARDNEGNTVLHLLAASDTLALNSKLDTAAHRKASRGLSARLKAPKSFDQASVAKDAELILATLRSLLEYERSHPADDAKANASANANAKAESSRPNSAMSPKQPLVLAENKLFYTALHCAALKGNTDAVRIFLQFRPSLTSDIDQLVVCSPVQVKKTKASGKLIRSCLYLTVANDHVECAQFLKQSGFALKPSRAVRVAVGEADEAEYLVESFLLHRLPCGDPIRTLHFLFQAGANTGAKYGENGDSVLHLAAAFSNVDVLEFVHEYLKLEEIDCCFNFRMQTALHSAVISHNQKTARFLLEHGARPILLDQAGCTPFDYIEDYAEWLASPVFNRTQDDRESYWRKEIRKAQLRNVKSVVREVSMHVLNSEYESIVGTQRDSDGDSRSTSRLTNHVAVSRASSATVHEHDNARPYSASPVPSIPMATDRQKSSLVIAESQRRFLSNLSAKLSSLNDETRKMNTLIQYGSPRLKMRPAEGVHLRRSQQARTLLQSARSILPYANVDLSDFRITRINSNMSA